MATSADIVNRALELVASQVRISGSAPAFDGSTAGNAAGVLYQPAVEALLRQIDPDFARTALALVAQANATVLALTRWTYEYAYPAASLRLRQIRPQPGDYDPLDPLPVRAQVMTDPLSAGGPARVVLTDQAGAIAVFTTGAAGVGAESLWDAGFQEAVARRLANPLAMALAGRPDFARELLEESAQFAQLAELSEEL